MKSSLRFFGVPAMLAVFTWLIMFSNTAFAQNVEYVGSYDSLFNALHVFIQGNYAFVADPASGIQIINISDPNNPSRVGCYYTQGWPMAIYISNNLCCAARGDSGMDIISVANPAAPILLGRFPTAPAWAIAVYVQDEYAYLIIESTLAIINISDPANPQSAGEYHPCAGGLSDVFVVGNHAYIVGCCVDEFPPTDRLFQILDISDHSNPVLMGSYVPSLGIITDIFVGSNYAYLNDAWTSNSWILNVSDPTNPVYAGNFNSQAVINDSYIVGDIAYLTRGDSGLQVINVNNPANPIFAGSYDTPGVANDVFVSGDYIYIADSSSFQILRFNPAGIDEGNSLPTSFSLSQNYPNPFNAQTTISYSLTKVSDVTIDIFDILGRNIETIEDGSKSAGNHQLIWDANGQSSGIYLYRIKAGDVTATRKMVLMK